MKHLALVWLLSAAPTVAKDSFDACFNKAKTQLEMNSCASDEAARADAGLNDAYHVLLAAVAGQQEAVRKIEAVERAWVAYRDAYMEATYPAEEKQAEYGSRFPMDWNLLRARLTVRQVTALKEMLESYTETH